MGADNKQDDKRVLDEAEAKGDQYLTFQLAGEEYGVEILRVQEIRGWERVTRIPNSPVYVQGVVNLRGSIVPIFDLRLRFNLPVGAYSKDTVVIVLMIKRASGGMRSIGVVVDGVSDVINATTTDIASTPEFGGRISTEWISGLASDGDQMIMLLDVDKMFAEQDESLGREENAA
jgi:purine-binding chemotaxis protein CheW